MGSKKERRFFIQECLKRELGKQITISTSIFSGLSCLEKCIGDSFGASQVAPDMF